MGDRLNDPIDLGDLSYLPSIDYELRHPSTDAPTGWVWTLAGPSHPATLAAQEAARKRDEEDRRRVLMLTLAGVPDHTPPLPEPIQRTRAAATIAARVLGFTPADLNGARVEYDPATAIRVLADPRNSWIPPQLALALTDDRRFIPGGADLPIIA